VRIATQSRQWNGGQRVFFKKRDIMVGGELYLRRWFLTPRIFGRRLLLHHIYKADPTRDLHCHPWSFWTLCLRGGYIEETERDGLKTIHVSGQMKYRDAEFRHRIDRVLGQCWTLVLAGPAVREWGFWTERGWVNWRQYLGIPTGSDTSKP
jgi:hypothetical protein